MGWKLVINGFVSVSVSRVEREPMWDGNVVLVWYVYGLMVLLSENQCGMETLFWSGMSMV